MPQSQTARSVDPVPGCADLHEWPQRWMGFPEDIPPGEQLVACFRPFLQHLSERHLSHKTIRKHVNNLWVLGGDIIRDLNDTRRRDTRRSTRWSLMPWRTVGDCRMAATQKMRYVPLSPPAASSVDSSNGSPVSSGHSPTDSSEEPITRSS